MLAPGYTVDLLCNDLCVKMTAVAESFARDRGFIRVGTMVTLRGRMGEGAYAVEFLRSRLMRDRMGETCT